MPILHTCVSCAKTFSTYPSLRNHANAKGHIANPFVCEQCDTSFYSALALESHMRSSRHAGQYPSAAYLDGRDWNGSELYESESDAGSDEYSSDNRDADETYCHGCARHFVNEMALNRHLVESLKHNWCFDCSRDFKSGTALSQHRASHTHLGRNFKCPFCSRMYKSPSGIALHLESGCHKIITRHHVTAAVHAMNIIPNLSIKRITGPMNPPTVRTYIATEASFNGTAYKCYLCPKTFRTLASLNGHLNSPAHDDDEFRCPKCKRKFKLISGFVQHLESRSCGLAKAGQVDNYFTDMTAQFSRLLKM